MTDHARTRLSERSVLTEEEFLALADACAVLVYRADADTHYEVLWSKKDANGYVLVLNPETGHIITIKRVLTREGSPCKMHDPRKKPSFAHRDAPGVADVTASMVEQAVLAAGAEISEAQSIIDTLKAHKKPGSRQPRAWNYRWMLRFLSAKPGGGVAAKTKTLGREAEIGDPPESIIAEAEAAVKAESGWGATLLLVKRDSMIEVGEWDIACERKVCQEYAKQPGGAVTTGMYDSRRRHQNSE